MGVSSVVQTVVQKYFKNDSINQWPQNSIHLTPLFINPHTAFSNLLYTLNFFRYWVLTILSQNQRKSHIKVRIEISYQNFELTPVPEIFRKFSGIFEKSEVNRRGLSRNVKHSQVFSIIFDPIFGPRISRKAYRMNFRLN